LGRPESWQPDPTGRWHLRWWNGRAWTDHVNTGEHTGIDRLADGEADLPPRADPAPSGDAPSDAVRGNGQASAREKLAADPLRLHGVEHVALHRTRRVLEDHLWAGEEVHAVVVGRPEQVLIALDERCLIIKIGMAAGATGTARVTSIRYQDVTDVVVSTGLVIGTLTIETADTDATPGDVRAINGLWTAKDADNPWKLPNVVPLGRAARAEFADDIELLRALVQDTRRASTLAVRPLPTPPGRSSIEIDAQLRLLGELHTAGDLGDEQFARGKAMVLEPYEARSVRPPPVQSEG
jgi:hypothetical protein